MKKISFFTLEFSSRNLKYANHAEVLCRIKSLTVNLSVFYKTLQIFSQRYDIYMSIKGKTMYFLALIYIFKPAKGVFKCLP